jgi:hypothetical protein
MSFRALKRDFDEVVIIDLLRLAVNREQVTPARIGVSIVLAVGEWALRYH